MPGPHIIITMTSPSARVQPFVRDDMLHRLRREDFDVVVIGGGVTGAGAALDAASRGLRTALIERDDLASGTSSRSSKLVHGGLRYLQNGEIRLVYEALHERHRLLRNARHLVRPLPFLIPVLNRDGVISRRIARALGGALWMYDLTGGWRIGHRHRRLDAAAVIEQVPTLDPERVAGGYLYYDASVDDARLTLTLARTAADHGAVVANRCRAESITTGPDGRIERIEVLADDGAGSTDRFNVTARCVVSATGVWADDIRAMSDPDAESLLRPARGVHLTVPWELIRNEAAVVIPVPGDRRSLFVIPWDRRDDGSYRFAYIGTTDTDHDGSLDEPGCTGDDIDYVLRALNKAFTSPDRPGPITVDDVTAVWSGLRPLVRSADSSRTADLSRRHHLTTSAEGIVTISGGKLTTYRAMASDTIDAVVRSLGGSRWRQRCRTRRLRLHGAAARTEPPTSSLTELDRHLAERYGTDAARLHALIASDPTLGEPLIGGLGYVRAEAIYAVTDEMAMSLSDVLVRRTQAHYRDRRACEDAADDVARLIAPLLGWDQGAIDHQVTQYRSLCETERITATIRNESSGSTTAEIPT